MERYKGKVATILVVNNYNNPTTYSLDIDREYWTWTEDMFKHNKKVKKEVW